jgi:hypothetical protein
MENLAVVKGKKTKEQIMNSKKGKLTTYLIPAVFFECGSFNLLAECVTGGVVVDIDSSRIVNPPGLDKVSMNEVAVLEQGYTLGKFSAADISVGLSSVRVESILSGLLSKSLIFRDNGMYEVSDSYKIVHDAKNYATEETPIIEAVDTASCTKLSPKFLVHQMAEKIGNLAKFNNMQECWIVYYKVN